MSKTDEEWEELERKYLKNEDRERNKDTKEHRKLSNGSKLFIVRWANSVHDWVQIFLRTLRTK